MTIKTSFYIFRIYSDKTIHLKIQRYIFNFCLFVLFFVISLHAKSPWYSIKALIEREIHKIKDGVAEKKTDALHN